MKKTSSVKRYRSYKDFKFGNFDCYVTENQIIIRGVLKKKKCISKYVEINFNEQ